MKKTSIYLEDELDAALALRAAEEGVTKAEFIRRALGDAVGRSAGPRPRPSIVAIATSGDPHLSERVDDALADGGFGT